MDVGRAEDREVVIQRDLQRLGRVGVLVNDLDAIEQTFLDKGAPSGWSSKRTLFSIRSAQEPSATAA